MGRKLTWLMMALIGEGFVNGLLMHVPDLSTLQMAGMEEMLSAMEGSTVSGQLAAGGMGMNLFSLLQFLAFVIPIGLAWRLGKLYGATAYAMGFLGGVLVVASNVVGFLLLFGSVMLGMFSVFWE